MINVDKCPHCSEATRVEIMKQDFNDVYIELINSDLNNEVRYWYECVNCNFIYRSPKLNGKEQEVLYEKYRDVSFRKETPEGYFDRITQYSDSKSENYQKVTWILKNIKHSHVVPHKIDKILDVGCGGGVLLHKIKTMLPQVVTYGVEPNDLYSELARKKSGANRIETAYFSSNLFDEKFDMIVSSDVLEHVDNPDVFLEDIFSSLKPHAGVLFLEVPSPTNFKHLDCKHDMFNIAHHVFFTKSVLEGWLYNCGFSEVLIEDIENNSVWKLRVLAYKV